MNESSVRGVLVFITLFLLHEISRGSNDYVFAEKPDQNIDLPESAYAGKASLAFVFDTTGSMHFVLDCVKSGASRILQTVLEMKKNIIHNFIFSPFNDPEIGPLTVTTDPTVYKQALDNVTVGGGGDCPELQLHGIKAALEASLPNSYIYVFTNSNAKDTELTDEILSLVQKKSCQVVFILTGYCLNYDIKRDVYTEIAAASFGQVFYLHQYNVNEMLEMIRLSLKENTVSLVSVDSPEQTDGIVTYNIAIDSMIDAIMISLSGKMATISITDSDGRLIHCSPTIRCLINLPNIKIIDIQNPSTGNWLINVTSESQYSLRTSGISEFYFQHGFSMTPTSYFNETNHRPLKGCINYVLIKLINCNYVQNLVSVEVLDLNGRVEQTLFPNQTVVNSSLYITSFIPENTFFHLRINGLLKDGFSIQRITKTAMSPLIHDNKCELQLKSEAPLVSIQPANIYFKRGDNISILCLIKAGYPVPTITWKKDNKTLQKAYGARYSIYQQLNHTYLSIMNARNSDEGIYVCFASNMFNTSIAYATLHYYEFPVIRASRNKIFALINSSVVLQCTASGTPIPVVTWFHGSSNLSCVRSSEKYEIFPEGKLIIHEYVSEDEGDYWCTATNIIGETFEVITLLTGSAPIVLHKNVVTSVLLRLNTTVTLNCQVTGGVPEPSVNWYSREACSKNFCPTTHVFVHIPTINDTLLIKEPGIYYCTAGNEFGNVTQIFNVTLQHDSEFPDEKATDIEIYKQRGEIVLLPCTDTGQAQYNISWYINDTEIFSGIQYKVTNATNQTFKIHQNGTLEISYMTDQISAIYICKVTSRSRVFKKRIHLKILELPRFTHGTNQYEVELYSSIKIPCEAKGSPNPNITWIRFGQRLLTTNSNQAIAVQENYLIITNTTKTHEGVYTCVASNIGGTNNRNITIAVFVKPKITSTLKDKRIVLNEGDDFAIDCSAIGSPTPIINWFNNFKIIVQHLDYKDENAMVLSNGTLLLMDVDESSNGLFSCRAENKKGVDTITYEVFVILDNYFNDETAEIIKVEELKSVVLKCPIEARSVSWLKEGLPLDMKNNERADESHYILLNGNRTLKIIETRSVDHGIYTCSADSAVGAAQTSIDHRNRLYHFRLYILRAPVFESDLYWNKINANRTSKVTMNCTADGFPPPRVNWSKVDNKVLPINKWTLSNVSMISQMKQVIQINYISDKHDGVYRCTAKNLVSSVTKYFALKLV